MMELRWRHLDHVESMARGNSTRAELRETLCKNFEHFFGRLRRRRKRRGAERQATAELHGVRDPGPRRRAPRRAGRGSSLRCQQI